MSIDTVLKCKCNANWKKISCQIIWITSESRRKIQITHFICSKPLQASICIFFERKTEKLKKETGGYLFFMLGYPVRTSIDIF